MSRAAYLRALGIETWVERRARPEAAPAASLSRAEPEPTEPSTVAENEPTTWLLQSSGNPLASVVVSWPDRQLELSASDPAAQLLLRMLGALEQPLDRFHIVGWAEGDPPPAVIGEPVFCLSDDGELASDWIRLPSLGRMLDEGRTAKGEAWATLKRWIPRLADR